MDKVETKPTVYVKTGCPWCIQALRFFREKEIDLHVVDVLRDRNSMRRLIAISGQTRTPTFEYGDFVVADFSIDEFLQALDRHPSVKEQLGFGTSAKWTT